MGRARGAPKKAPRYPILGSRGQTTARDLELDWHGVTLVLDLSTCVFITFSNFQVTELSEAKREACSPTEDGTTNIVI